MAAEATSLLTSLLFPPGAATALACLSAPVRDWFVGRFGQPTPAQRLAWPAVSAADNLLLGAPTGTGKTLAAFLPLLDRLRHEPPQGCRVLYVAPLKALCNDACRNLDRHVAELDAGSPAGSRPLRMAVRTGDTTGYRRRRAVLRPPDVLLTTPESLAILLCQRVGCRLLSSVRTVVVDEVHVFAPIKRGADLALSLERLTAVAGRELQRIGLSATCAPIEEAARFLVGVERPCTIATVPDRAGLHLEVEPLPTAERTETGFLPALVERLGPELEAHGSTLIFTNLRRLTERVGWALRRRYPQWDGAIGVHHSALAASRRREVEERFKAGELRAVVTSASLELGIDVGSVDNVVLVHPPGGVVRLLQRIGRAGHRPGMPRRGLVLTTSAADLLEASVTCAGGRSSELERIRVPSRPLDVLCQHLIGLAAVGSCTPETALALARRAYPYRNLPRSDVDACLAYLSGKRLDGRDWLPPRLLERDSEYTLVSEQVGRLLLRNVGTILGEALRCVRFLEPPAGGLPWTLLGQVSEAFADRLRPGDRFLLDGRCLQLVRTQGPELLVEEVFGRPVAASWLGNPWPLAPELARRLYLLRARAAEALREGVPSLLELLRHDYALGARAARMLASYFQRQESVSEIPDAATCLIEAIPCPGGADYFVHTPLNAPANDALARIAVLRLARRCDSEVVSQVADLGFQLTVPGHEVTPALWREVLRADHFDADLSEAIAASDAFRERFAQVAQTAMMRLRNPLAGPSRLGANGWADRRLFDQVRADEPQFVLLRQALREVHEEVGDAAAARAFVADLPRLAIRLRWLQSPSPFVEGWTQLKEGAADAVASPEEALERLHAALTSAGRVA